jgi:CheY-like chemotaxis protein
LSTIDASDHDSRDVVDRYRVVVVMASFDLAITLKRLLEKLGYAAEIATDGQAGLELVISMQPDAVISAIELAGLDGFELASRIRDSVPRKPLMIANSSYCKTDIAERARKCGFDLFLPKPAQIEDLKRALAVVEKNSGADDLRF